MRLSEKQLDVLAERYAKDNGFDYGRGFGKLLLTGTDARCAPYNYKLVVGCNNGGAIHDLTGAMTAREMYNALLLGDRYAQDAKRFIERMKEWQ